MYTHTSILLDVGIITARGAVDSIATLEIYSSHRVVLSYPINRSDPGAIIAATTVITLTLSHHSAVPSS